MCCSGVRFSWCLSPRAIKCLSALRAPSAFNYANFKILVFLFPIQWLSFATITTLFKLHIIIFFINKQGKLILFVILFVNIFFVTLYILNQLLPLHRLHVFHWVTSIQSLPWFLISHLEFEGVLKLKDRMQIVWHLFNVNKWNCGLSFCVRVCLFLVSTVVAFLARLSSSSTRMTSLSKMPSSAKCNLYSSYLQAGGK